MSFLLANLQIALVQDFQNNVIDGSVFAESLCEVGGGRGLAFGDVEEDGGDLEDIVEVGLDAGAVFEDFVLVTGDFETLLTALEPYERDVGELDLVGGL